MSDKIRIYPKKETPFILEFMTVLERCCNVKLWKFKTHGEPMQTRGLPDIIMCYGGIFVGIEFKIKRRNKINATPLQEYMLSLIEEAGGIGIIIWYDESTGNVGIGNKEFSGTLQAASFLASLLLPKVNIIKQFDKKIKDVLASRSNSKSPL